MKLFKGRVPLFVINANTRQRSMFSPTPLLSFPSQTRIPKTRTHRRRVMLTLSPFARSCVSVFGVVFVLRPLQIVIAMSVASWYFARNKSHVGSLTVVASVGKTFVFHIGTAAFGALIVAIVEVS